MSDLISRQATINLIHSFALTAEQKWRYSMGVYIKGITKEDLLKILPVLESAVIEVPEPHGRLIDADFEEKHYASMTINPTPDVTPQDYMHSGYAAKAFQMAKTVIEAEE